MKKTLNTTLIVILTAGLILLTFGCKRSSTSQFEQQERVTEIQVETEVETLVTETVIETTLMETQSQKLLDQSKEVEAKFGELDANVENIGNIFTFIDQNIRDSTPELASEMVYTVMELCEEYKFDFTDKFYNTEVQSTIGNMLPSLESIDLSILLATDNQMVKDLIQETINKKYKLIAIPGLILPLVD